MAVNSVYNQPYLDLVGCEGWPLYRVHDVIVGMLKWLANLEIKRQDSTVLATITCLF